MTDRHGFKTFEDAEHRGRLARAQAALQGAGLDAVVCVGPELLYYFTGYDAHTHFSQQALIIGARDAEPTLIHRDVDEGNALESAWARDRRVYHHGPDDPAQLVAQACRERAAGGGRIGLCLNSYALPASNGLALLEALKPLEVADASALMEGLRLVKSPAEVALIREAGRFAEAGLDAARSSLRPGITEIQAAGAIEKTMRELGSEYPAMPVWLAGGPRARGAHKTPRDRVIEAGERVKMEFAGVKARYHAVTMQTLWVGGEPAAGGRRAYEAAAESLRTGSAAIAVGAPVAAAEDAAFAVLAAAGFDVATHSRFGYGVGIAYPPTWLESLDITRASDARFESGMSFVLHASVRDPEENLGLLIGGAYLLTAEKGLECLSGGPLALAVV